MTFDRLPLSLNLRVSSYVIFLCSDRFLVTRAPPRAVMLAMAGQSFETSPGRALPVSLRQTNKHLNLDTATIAAQLTSRSLPAIGSCRFLAVRGSFLPP